MDGKEKDEGNNRGGRRNVAAWLVVGGSETNVTGRFG